MSRMSDKDGVLKSGSFKSRLLQVEIIGLRHPVIVV